MGTDQTSELQPIACTLSGSDQGQRVREWQDLLAHGTAREPVPDGIRVTLPAAWPARSPSWPRPSSAAARSSGSRWSSTAVTFS